jgi:hypothetical protein
MGTSQSSKGAPSNVPMVPPWVPDVPASTPVPAPGNPPANEPRQQDPATSTLTMPAIPPVRRAPIAPAGRFSAARRAAGAFAQSGSAVQLRRSLGHFVRRGYNGAKTATSRFGGTVSTADALYGALTPGQPVGGAAPALDRDVLVGRSAAQIMDAVVEAVRPIDGTLDAEASRLAIKDALSELLVKFPEADLLDLSEDERAFVIERFVAVDVFQRYALDVGKTIQDKATSPRVALRRLKEVKEYVKEAVAAKFRAHRVAGQRLLAGRVKQIVQAALLEIFQVFENYAE